MTYAVQLVRAEIERQLDRLAKHFVPEARLTFLMRVPGHPDKSLLVTSDTPEGIEEAIRHLRTAPDTEKHEPARGALPVPFAEPPSDPRPPHNARRGPCTPAFGGSLVTRPHLRIVPCSITDARAWVRLVHRHHDAPLSGLFALAVLDDAHELRGVLIAGRPVSRHQDDGWTIEVTRVATDGCDNACSALYGAAERAGRALGYTAGTTCTLPSEGGASLRGAGWVREPEPVGGGEWSREGRERDAAAVPGVKVRWWWPGSCLPVRRVNPARGWCRADDPVQAALFAGVGA